jgi:hypothetical protein
MAKVITQANSWMDKLEMKMEAWAERLFNPLYSLFPYVKDDILERYKLKKEPVERSTKVSSICIILHHLSVRIKILFDRFIEDDTATNR